MNNCNYLKTELHTLNFGVGEEWLLRMKDLLIINDLWDLAKDLPMNHPKASSLINLNIQYMLLMQIEDKNFGFTHEWDTKRKWNYIKGAIKK